MPRFIVTGFVSGTWTEIIEASDKKAAEQQAWDMLNNDDRCPEPDSIDDASVNYVQELPHT